MKWGKEGITVPLRDLTPNLQNKNVSQEEQNQACLFWKSSSDVSDRPPALLENHCHYSYLILYLVLFTQKEARKLYT